MSQNPISNSLLNVVLVLIESTITLVLRFDPNLRRAVYPLAQKNTVVCVRSYLPHTQVYATFTNKGILLDTEIPFYNKEVDVVINAYSHQLINCLFSNDPTQVNKLTMRGSADTVAEVRSFLVQLGVASLFQGIIKTFKGKDKNTTHKQTGDSEDKANYKARIEEQQQQLNTLSKRNRELEVSLKEAQSKQKATLIALVIAVLIAITAIIGWVS